MSSLGLSVGTYFAEASACKEGLVVSSRWYLPKKNLKDGLKEFLDSHQLIPHIKTIRVCTDFAHLLVERRAGAKVALIVNSGFENWPQLRQPCLEEHFTLKPSRASTLLTSDFIFGVSERTNAKGEVIEPLVMEELEFLASKLELMEVKHVAVGLLHSYLNPESEKKMAEFFEKKGIHTTCSHEIEESNNEVARWWRATLNAYVSSNFQEIFSADFIQQLKDLNLKLEFWGSNRECLSESHNDFFDTAFSKISALLNLVSPKTSQHLLHMGFDENIWVYVNESQSIWQSDFGPVSIKTPRHKKLPVQPLQKIIKSPWGTADLETEEAHFEPGPMIFGRALQPTLLDLQYLMDENFKPEGLTGLISPKAKDRIRENFFTIAKDLHSNKSYEVQELCTHLLDIAICQVAHFIHHNTQENSEILLTGPMAEYWIQPLKKKIQNRHLSLAENSQFSESIGAIG